MRPRCACWPLPGAGALTDSAGRPTPLSVLGPRVGTVRCAVLTRPAIDSSVERTRRDQARLFAIAGNRGLRITPVGRWPSSPGVRRPLSGPARSIALACPQVEEPFFFASAIVFAYPVSGAAVRRPGRRVDCGLRVVLPCKFAYCDEFHRTLANREAARQRPAHVGFATIRYLRPLRARNGLSGRGRLRMIARGPNSGCHAVLCTNRTWSGVDVKFFIFIFRSLRWRPSWR